METHRLQASFRHIAGVLNVTADSLSREERNHIEWKMAPRLFENILENLRVTVDVDLFASSQNRQTERFFSWGHDFESEGCDCLAHQWAELGNMYAYPPPIMLGRTVTSK